MTLENRVTRTRKFELLFFKNHSVLAESAMAENELILIGLDWNWLKVEETSSNSISQEVLMVSRSSEYFHLDKSYFLPA